MQGAGGLDLAGDPGGRVPELAEESPGLEGGYGLFDEGADSGVGSVHRLLTGGQGLPSAEPAGRRSDAANGYRVLGGADGVWRTGNARASGRASTQAGPAGPARLSGEAVANSVPGSQPTTTSSSEMMLPKLFRSTKFLWSGSTVFSQFSQKKSALRSSIVSNHVSTTES